MRQIRLERARKIALAAQGLHRRRPSGRVDVRHLRRVFSEIGVLQIDSVNVVERAHHLTLFSRLGPYDTELLWRAFEQRRELFEYWGHAASFLPVETFPLFRYRMDTIRTWKRIESYLGDHPAYVGDVLRQITERGPLQPSDLEDPGEGTGPWWGWSKGKTVLEWLFARGRVTSAYRRNFARFYDLTERVIPAKHFLAEPYPGEEARRRLLLMSARSLGIATARDLADYYRLNITQARPAVADLAAEGRLEEVQVAGWNEEAYLHPEAVTPRRLRRGALLCPFDSLVFFRDRVQRLFGFDYRIEIYTPKHKRRYGYYVFPFLLGDRLAARVDLKADRQSRSLVVRGAFLEDGSRPSQVGGALGAELADMAAWLGLDDVVVADHGDLAPALRRAIG